MTTTQEIFLCSLVLKLKVFISKYLQEHYTWCITRAALFFRNVLGVFFNVRHQVEAIAIGVSEADPVVEIVSVFLLHFRSTYMHMHIVIDLEEDQDLCI